MRPSSIVLCFAAVAVSAPLLAQTFTTAPCTGESSHYGSRPRACELRRTVLAFQNGHVNVLGNNGGIEVIGEDRRDVALEAEVVAQARSEGEARSLLHEVSLDTGDPIQAHGPKIGNDRTWYVNFRLRVPRHLAAQVRTMNGGVSLTGVEGDIRAETTNGGLILRDLGGNVAATTVNGGAEVALAGNHWNGTGLSVRSTNGGLTVSLPQPFNAHLVASTVNGGLSVGFPVTLQGNITRQLDTTLGTGGATLRFETTNGGVHLGTR